MAQVAAAWSMQKEGISAPIVGTTSLKNLEELIGMSFLGSHLTCDLLNADITSKAAVDIRLTEQEIKELEEPYQPVPVFHH